MPILPTKILIYLPVAVVLLGGAAVAQADPGTEGDDQVNCTVRSMLGATKAGGVDKRLASLRAKFSKPPFSSYKTIRLLSSKALKIGHGKLQQTQLPTGKILRLTFKEALLVKKKVRLRMHLSITPPKAKSFLPGTLFTIANGGTLLVAGDPHADGTLIVGITCKN